MFSALAALILGQVPLPGTSSVTVALAAPSSCRDCHGAFDPVHDAYDTWEGSAMANSARNPLFLSALTEAEKDSPGIGDFCLRCHAPDAWLQGRCTPTNGSQLTDNDTGTTCAVCHRMDPSPWKMNGQFLLGDDRIYRGEYMDSMASHDVQYSRWLEDPAFCAPCHDLRNPRVAWRGHEPQPFPEQSTYSEWAHSAYASADHTVRKTCQDCHLPTSMGQADQRGPVRAARAAHDLAGGNVFLPAALAFLDPGLGITDALNAGQARAEAMLQKAATIEVTTATDAFARGAPVSLHIRVTNHAGHKLPTGYPEGRRVWVEIESPSLGLHLGAYDAAGGEPSGAPAIYYTRQTASSTDAPFHVALLDTIEYDSRIPPLGMAVTATIAPVGKRYLEVSPGVLANYDDLSVTGTVACDAPADFKVRVSLLYQSVTKAYAGALVRRNGSDPRGLRLQLAMDNADPGPFEMAFAEIALHSAQGSSCAQPDGGVVEDASPPPDSGLALDAGALPDVSSREDAGSSDSGRSVGPAPKGCSCDAAHGGPERTRADVVPLVILLVLSIGMMKKRALLLLLVALAASCGGSKMTTPPPPMAPVIDTTALPDVKLGAAYDQTITAHGGTPPYTFSLAGGGLPDGLDLKSSGQITGLAGRAGHARFTVQVADTKMKTATADLVVYVVPDPLQILTTALPSGKQGTAYNQMLTAKGGVAPLAFSLAKGALPMGLAVAPEGKVGGTPSEFGSFDFTVEVKDQENGTADQPLHLTLRSLNPMIATSSVPKGRVAQPYNTTLAAEGGDVPYTWSIASGRSPMGLNLSTDGVFAGTPTESGTFMIAIQVLDASNHKDLKDVTLTIIAPLSVSTVSLPQILQGRPYRAQLTASGGEPPYTWSLGQAANTLPPGISIDATGKIQGMTMMLGDYPLNVRVTDAEGFQKSALFDLKVTDRYTYTATSAVPIPATCRTGTTVSYQTISLNVPDSYQIDQLDAIIKVTYPAPNDPLRIILWSPTGIEALLCGNGANDGSTTNSGGHTCTSPFIQQSMGGVDQTFTDNGTPSQHPDTPLATFRGTNPKGTWKLSVGVVSPNCQTTGHIDMLQLQIKDDRTTLPYVFVRGYTKNNLVIEPMVRICSPSPPPNRSCGAIDEHQLQLRATAYSLGPNGIAEGGAGDDVPMPEALTWAWQGAPIPDVTLSPTGSITAGRFTGMSMINVSGMGVSQSFTLRVVAPKWNPIFRGF